MDGETDINAAFAELTRGVELGYGWFDLPEVPYNGRAVKADPMSAEVFRQSALSSIDQEIVDSKILPGDLSNPKNMVNLGDILLSCLIEPRTLVRIRDVISVTGQGLLGVHDRGANYQDPSYIFGLKPSRRLFGRIMAAGFGQYLDYDSPEAVPEDVSKIEHKQGPLLILENVSVCNKDINGTIESTYYRAVVPLGKMTLSFSKILNLAI